MHLSYLEQIGAKNLGDFMHKDAQEVFPGFSTVNFAYREKLLKMQHCLEDYIKDETLARPLLYLILGPAGSGKSYLIECLANSLRREGKNVAFQQANLSEMVDPRELYPLFRNIKYNNDNGMNTVTVLDEFDIKWGGSSAIKYLINPIYDGKFWDGTQFLKFGKCAFFFAGSYLQDRETLLKIQKTTAGVNMSKFLFDTYLEMRKRNDLRAMQQIKELYDFCHTHQNWSAIVDPRSDVILYLRGLEKIKDFLSRVGGNFFEIIDLSWPLAITQKLFIIEVEKGWEVKPSTKAKLFDIEDFVKQLDEKEKHFISYNSPSDLLLEYKNVLLCERLVRVIQLIKKRFKPIFKEEKDFEIDRKLLNFLTVVPLINGMRSLEQLINMLHPSSRQIKDQKFDQDEMKMIIHDFNKFVNPTQTWGKLENENRSLVNIMENNKTQGADYICIPLTEDKVVPTQ